MNELPQGWADTSLGEVIELRYGKSLPEKDRVPGDFGVYGSNGVVGSHTFAVTDAPAIVVGRKGSIGEVHFSETACFPIDTTYFVDRFDCTDPRFALHLLRHLPLREMNRASAIPGLNREDAYGLPIALPPLSEQRRIATKIDSLTGKSRRARDHLDHIPRLVEKYKQAVLAAAFRGDLTRAWRAEGGVSPVYRKAALADVLTDIRYGTAKKCDYGAGDTPVLRIPNVQRGEIALDDLKSADFEEAELRKLRLRPGDLLVIRSNGSVGLVGRCAIVNDAAAGMLFAGYLIRLRVDPERALPSYVHLWLQSASMRSIIEGLAKSTSGVNNINSTQIEQLPVKLAGLDEQHEIVRRIEAAFAWIDRLAAEATNARRLIDRLDHAILAKAFRGELVPQDPDDEPAGALLDRIRAERGASPKAKRGRKAKAT